MGIFSAHQIDPAEIERSFGPVLIEGERVLVAFKAVRDTAFLTTHRFVLVDVQGLSGSKVAVQSVPYRSIVRFSVESAGTFDIDSDLHIWASGMASPLTVKISREADSQAILRLLSEQVLAKR
jgi:hypothetical protein